ncbi:NAD(P)H-binding protein [Brevundimonas vesicularis]|uniref:NAD(P)H-binding protein n=1 Tax=Brevundimonas vesicularis TaxID=41276 RepID=UPI0022AC0DCC|nr:NAD(P)H-binding protein [Brevundimonas vesicularis]
MLVLGGNGFIGSHVAAALSSAGWSVRAGARRIAEPARRAPTFDWVAADFAKLTTPQAWAPVLVGVEAVVNCVGVLQNGAGDSTRAAHVDGPRALIAACEAAGVRRLVHISAVGADDGAGTDYARTKAETERLIESSGLDWLILRPSLVVDRAAFGGTGLIRALAAFPLFSPVVGGDQIFRPIPLGDLSAAVVAALKPTAPSHRTLDMPGPEPVTMVETMRLYRGWMGVEPGAGDPRSACPGRARPGDRRSAGSAGLVLADPHDGDQTDGPRRVRPRQRLGAGAWRAVARIHTLPRRDTGLGSGRLARAALVRAADLHRDTGPVLVDYRPDQLRPGLGPRRRHPA